MYIKYINNTIAILFILLLLSCGHSSTEIATDFMEEKNIVPTHIATFEVEGMMCEKGCGAILRKGLYETGGVAEVKVDYDEENPVNEIQVYFDGQKTSTGNMIQIISNLADKRYSAKLKKISESTIISYVPTVNLEKDNSDYTAPKDKHSFLKMTESSTKASSRKKISFPSLINLLNQLIY